MTGAHSLLTVKKVCCMSYVDTEATLSLRHKMHGTLTQM